MWYPSLLVIFDFACLTSIRVLFDDYSIKLSSNFLYKIIVGVITRVAVLPFHKFIVLAIPFLFAPTVWANTFQYQSCFLIVFFFLKYHLRFP
jgi:hypothetical protein